MKHFKTFVEINEGVPNDDLTIYQIVCRDQDGTLKEMIEHIAAIGNTGHSFSIVVDPDATKEEGKATFEWDGDGSDYIKEVKTIQEAKK
jgi:hypothetical protein